MITLDLLKRFDGLVGIVHLENALQEADRKVLEVVGREGCLIAEPVPPGAAPNGNVAT